MSWDYNIMNQWLYNGLYIIYIITILGTVLVVVSENRNPVKTIAWVVVLALLPVIGLIFYFYFGQDFTKYRMISRKSLKKLKDQAEYAVAELAVHLPENTKEQIQLSYSTSQSILFAENSVKIFTEGKEKFQKLKEELLKATAFIHIQYYIFEDDILGNEIKQILINKAHEGLEVRLVYDDIGSLHVKNKFFKEMADAGVQVRPFLKVTFPRLSNKINYRNHRKIVVIDGKVGFMGGMNVADRYRDGLSWGKWRDTHIMIKGAAVHGLQSSFSVDWYFSTKQLLSKSIYFPEVASCGNVNMQIVTSGPVGEWKSVALGLFRAISNAKHYVYLQTPYFLPTESILTALQMAALSKVDVRIMLPMRSDSDIIHRASGSYIKPMLLAGVKIYFYKPGFLHAKTIVVDDNFSSVGSANIDFRSFEHNFEVNSFMYGRDIASRMKEIFLEDQKKCDRITLLHWRRRPLIQKIKESIARLLSPLL